MSKKRQSEMSSRPADLDDRVDAKVLVAERDQDTVKLNKNLGSHSNPETETIFLQNDAIISVKSLSRERRLADVERRLERVERKVNSNERFARTLSKCLGTQVLATDAVVEVVRKCLREDAELRDELTAAIKEYDKRKVVRWLSGLGGAVIKVVALAAAAFAGAFIYWVFCGM